ncbi:MAG: hypothetical protein ACKVP2_18730 [Burkholderiales bacterium]
MTLLEEFAERVKAELPEYAVHLAPVPASLPERPYHEAIGIPWPPDPARGRLSAFFRGDCLEMSFSVTGTRGPAEMQIVGDPPDDPRTMVEGAICFLRDFFSERLVVVVERYRWLWFSPHCLPFFHRLSERPFSRRVSEVISWRGTHSERRQT